MAKEPRYHYRSPTTHEVVPAYKLRVYRGWLAAGTLSAAAAAALRVWRKGTDESTAVLLTTLL